MTRNEANRLIAEKCEGLDVKWDEDQGVYVRFSHWLTPFRGSPDPCFIPLDDYFTDIAACVRAAEAWRQQAEGRSYEFRSGLSDYFGIRAPHAVCFSGASQIAGTGESLAAALVEAVK